MKDELLVIFEEIKALDFDLCKRLIHACVQKEYNDAYFWYLKGFKDSETTEPTEDISLEETMKDAAGHFQTLWDYYELNNT